MERKNNLSSASPLVKDIVFIHGITSFGKSHIKLCEHLARKGYIFHYFDLPGHGEKQWEWKTHKFTFDDMLNFVDEYIKINIKDKPFMIMGHSMGGGIALSTYTKHKSHIAAVILECPLTPAVFVRRSQIDKNDLKNFSQKIKRTRELIKSKWMQFILGIKKWLGKDKCFAPLLADIIKGPALEKINNGIKKINVPTLLILGENDPVIPPITTSEFLKLNIKTLTIGMVKNAGHNPFKDASKQYEEFIDDFLQKINN